MTHLSDSAVQREAEATIVERLGADLGLALIAGGRIPVGENAHVQVDARSEADDVLVEVYARQGSLKGAQLKKVGQDVLKFALLRQSDAWVDSRMILAFASSEAKDSVRGWVAEAARAFEVMLVVVELPADVGDRIRSAQQRQVMVNLSADDAAALADDS